MSVLLLLVGLLVTPAGGRRCRCGGGAAGPVAVAVGWRVSLVGLTSVPSASVGLGGTICDQVDELASETDGYTEQGPTA